MIEKQQKQQQVTQLKPPLDGRLIGVHFQAMPDSYFRQYDCLAIHAHLQLLSRLRPERRVCLQADKTGPHKWQLTVAALDLHGLLSCLCALFARHGLDIRNATVHSYNSAAVEQKLLVDTFEVIAYRGGPRISTQQWDELAAELDQAAAYLQENRLQQALLHIQQAAAV